MDINSGMVEKSKPNTPVAVVLNDLDAEIRITQDFIHNLEDRIGPALTKEPNEAPSAIQGESDQSPASDLVQEIRAARMKLSRQNERLQRIINRIEL